MPEKAGIMETWRGYMNNESRLSQLESEHEI